MLSGKESKYTKNFLKKLTERPSQVSPRGVQHLDKVIIYLNSLTDYRFKKLISDPYWINYPAWSSKGAGKQHGPVISMVVNHMCSFSESRKRALISHADGLFLKETIKSLAGRDRLKACERGATSKDSRVRLAAAKHLPLNKIKPMLNDSRSSIRSAVIKRIGIDNCASDLIYDKDFWIRVKGTEAASMSKELVKEQFDFYLEQIREDDSVGWYTSWILFALAKKLSNEDLIYYLDLQTMSDSNLGEYIRKRFLYSDCKKAKRRG